MLKLNRLILTSSVTQWLVLREQLRAAQGKAEIWQFYILFQRTLDIQMFHTDLSTHPDIFTQAL